jgi:hypothetical protein
MQRNKAALDLSHPVKDKEETYFEKWALTSTTISNAGIFTEQLNDLMTNNIMKSEKNVNKPIEKANYAAPNPVYSMFHTVLADIFPWTITFTQPEPSNTSSMKVTLSLPLTIDGVQIFNWK